MTLDEIRENISRYVPASSIDICAGWISEYRFLLRITKSRHSKYGDYRPPKNGKGHIITVNHDLNPFAFLITFTHEVAHLVTFLKTRTLRDPHGLPWKKEFEKLMQPFFDKKVFPDQLTVALRHYLKNPAATSCTDTGLLRELKKFDRVSGGWMLLEEIDFNSRFRIRTGRVFIKKELVRKNFLCIEAKSKQRYTLNPLMEVQLLEENS